MACGLPLDVMVVRKIGAPGNREYAMGAVASGGAVVLNPDVMRDFYMTEESCSHVIEAQKQEIERLESLYREGRPPIEFGEAA